MTIYVYRTTTSQLTSSLLSQVQVFAAVVFPAASWAIAKIWLHRTHLQSNMTSS